MQKKGGKKAPPLGSVVKRGRKWRLAATRELSHVAWLVLESRRAEGDRHSHQWLPNRSVPSLSNQQCRSWPINGKGERTVTLSAFSVGLKDMYVGIAQGWIVPGWDILERLFVHGDQRRTDGRYWLKWLDMRNER